MKTPTQYRKLIADLSVDQIPLGGKTPDETQKILGQLNELHTQIHDLEVNLNQDIHALRAQYQGKLVALGINSRRKIQIGEEQRIEAEREERLSPYEEIKKQLQALLTQIEEKQAGISK
jgi:hypothetical protein